MRKLALVAAVSLGLSGCAWYQKGTDVLSEAVLPLAEEKKLGAQLSAEVNQKEKVLAQPEIQAYIDQIGQRMAKATKQARKGIRYDFTVLDKPGEVNAFALPGGYIYLYSGLLERASSEAEIAAVLGHEIGHVTRRHAAKALVNVMGIQLIADMALGKNPGAVSQVAAGIAAQGYMAQHSRDAEREADTRGLQYVLKAGYQPQAMPRFFDKLADLGGKDPGAVQRFFASHPAPRERAQATREAIEKKGNPGGAEELVGGFDRMMALLRGAPGPVRSSR